MASTTQTLVPNLKISSYKFAIITSLRLSFSSPYPTPVSRFLPITLAKHSIDSNSVIKILKHTTDGHWHQITNRLREWKTYGIAELHLGKQGARYKTLL